MMLCTGHVLCSCKKEASRANLGHAVTAFFFCFGPFFHQIRLQAWQCRGVVLLSFLPLEFMQACLWQTSCPLSP